jgi:hypothetical protein
VSGPSGRSVRWGRHSTPLGALEGRVDSSSDLGLFALNVLLSIALLACWLPARRDSRQSGRSPASRVDIRHEPPDRARVMASDITPDKSPSGDESMLTVRARDRCHTSDFVQGSAEYRSGLGSPFIGMPRTLGVERVLTSRRGHTDQVPPHFCRKTRPSQAPVPVLSRPRRSERAPMSWREH